MQKFPSSESLCPSTSAPASLLDARLVHADAACMVRTVPVVDVVLPTAYEKGDIITSKYLFGRLIQMLRKKRRRKARG